MKFLPIFLVFLLPCIVKCWGVKSSPTEDLDPEDSLDEDSFEEYFHLENITDPVEHKKREDALSENEAIIKEENDEYLAGNKTWYDKVNEFSDLPADEFKDEKTGDLKPAEFGRGLLEPALDSPDRVDAASERYFAEFRNSMRTNRGSIPDGYSSVRNGYVSPVRNQKQCGSCVAFANMAIVETCFLKLTGAAGDYSEQQFVDCGYKQNGAGGCKGAYSYSYVKTFADSKMSLTAEATYPYKNKKPALECPASIKPYNKGASISGSAYTYSGDEETMEGLVYKHGAVTTAIATSGPGFMDYSGGIYAGCTNEKTDHAVTVVGYGTNKQTGMKFWLVKNSWGTGWGKDGYFKMQRGVKMCGIGGVMVTVECQAVAGPTDATLVPEEPCEDKYSNCGDYKDYCNHDNIKSGCPSTCGLCPGQTPDASTTCFDDFGNCPSLAKNKCYKYADKCQKSCGMCEGMTPAASNTCYNVYSNCGDLCGSSYADKCKKACGKC